MSFSDPEGTNKVMKEAAKEAIVHVEMTSHLEGNQMTADGWAYGEFAADGIEGRVLVVGADHVDLMEFIMLAVKYPGGIRSLSELLKQYRKG